MNVLIGPPIARTRSWSAGGGQRLMGEVETHHGDVPVGPKDDVGGLGVGVHVELSSGRHIASCVASAHRDDGLDPIDDARLLADRQGDLV